jgi:hypothetical protein
MWGALAAEGAFYMALKNSVDEADAMRLHCKCFAICTCQHESRALTEAEKDRLVALLVADEKRQRELDENWMRVAPGADAAIWRPWSRETGEL